MYNFSIEKVANFIIYALDHNVQNLTKTKLMKLMFYTDKYHLEEYGRAVFGDDYYKLPHGPVPTTTLNIINSINEFDNPELEEYVKQLSKFITTSTTYYNEKKATTFNKVQNFDESLFSRSETKIFKKVLNQFRTTTASEISDISHETREYIQTEMQSQIRFAQMAGDMQEYVSFIESENQEFSEIING